MDRTTELLWQVIFILTFVTVLGILVYRLLYRKDLKKSKTMTAKITAVITSEEYIGNDHDTYEYYTTYEFTVDGQEYREFSINFNPFHIFKKVTVFYDPQQPRRSMTRYEKYRCNGTLIVIGMLAVVFMIFGVPMILIALFA